MNLYGFQEKAVDWLSKKDRAILALDQGLGKTICALASLPKGSKVLIVCPASVKFVWKQEIEKWTDLTYQVLTTKCTIRYDVRVTIINYDIAAKMEHRLPKRWAVLVLDESQYLKNGKAKRTKACTRWILNAGKVWALSGTPIPNRPIELFPLLHAMRIIKMDWYAFGKKYCAGWKAPWTGGSLDVSGSSNLDELRKSIAPYTFRLTKEQVLPDLPDKTYQIISLDLPVDKREKGFSLEEIGKVVSPLSILGLPEIMHDHGMSKVPLAVEHILDMKQPGKPILVFAHHRGVIEAVDEKLMAAGFKVDTLTGATKSQDREEIVKDFQAGRLDFFIVNVQAGKTGLTLTAASCVIFIESAWAPADIMQAVDRVHRIGQKDKVLAQFLTIEGSIDQYQLKRALQKKEVVSQIIEEREVIMSKEKEPIERIADAFERIADAVEGWANFTPKAVRTKPADDVIDVEPEGKAEEDKPKRRTRRTKAQIAADEAEAAGKSEEVIGVAFAKLTDVASWDAEGNITLKEPQLTPEELSALLEESGEELTPVPVEELKAALMSYRDANDMEAAKGLLQEFEVQKISDLPVDAHQAFMERCGGIQKVFKLKDCLEALTDVKNGPGKDKAVEILGKYECKNLSSLPENQFGAFVKDCRGAVA